MILKLLLRWWCSSLEVMLVPEWKTFEFVGYEYKHRYRQIDR